MCIAFITGKNKNVKKLKEVNQMSKSSQSLVPNAKDKLDKMKYEVAGEVGVTLGGGYNGDIKAKDAGRIGGNMVKQMIKYAEENMR
jgi:hypothetical protein